MVNTKEIPPEAILLGVYLELQNGVWTRTDPDMRLTLSCATVGNVRHAHLIERLSKGLS